MTESSPPPSSSGRHSGRWVLLAVGTVCLLPLMIAMYLRFISPPEVISLSGKPLEPFAFPYGSVQQLDGQPMAHPAVSEHWLLVHTGSGACALACRDALYLTRQARTAQGRNMARIQRIWIISDATPPAADLLAAHPDLLLLHAADERVTRQLGDGTSSMSPPIYLVDRRGFVVFRYTATVEPGVFIRELGKLVRF